MQEYSNEPNPGRPRVLQHGDGEIPVFFISENRLYVTDFFAPREKMTARTARYAHETARPFSSSRTLRQEAYHLIPAAHRASPRETPFGHDLKNEYFVIFFTALKGLNSSSVEFKRRASHRWNECQAFLHIRIHTNRIHGKFVQLTRFIPGHFSIYASVRRTACAVRLTGLVMNRVSAPRFALRLTTRWSRPRPLAGSAPLRPVGTENCLRNFRPQLAAAHHEPR